MSIYILSAWAFWFLARQPMAAISATMYLLIGRRFFSRTGNPAFNTALSVFIAAYGVSVYCGSSL